MKHAGMLSRLSVRYNGWGDNFELGRLAAGGDGVLFQYSVEALEQGLELSPVQLPLRRAGYPSGPQHMLKLPGLMADSLPDGWGLLLMDRIFRAKGLRHPGPLDRLAFLGDRAMGALRFVPPESAEPEPDWDLLTLARNAMQELAAVEDGESDAEAGVTLKKLMVAGGSPQGARPKALVNYDAATGRVSTSSQAPGSAWLVKFPGQGEHKEVCSIEQVYAGLARDCGIDLPTTHAFDIDAQLAAFGVERFDRAGNFRVPVHSLAGLLHADFRVPGAVDYTGFLRATRRLTGDQREVDKAFQRCVFNVCVHNRDDHPKNFAWRLGRDRRWRLAPAFDLTFSEGPMGQHHMDICGEGAEVTRAHLDLLARQGAIDADFAQAVIERTLQATKGLEAKLREAGVRGSTVRRIASSVAACRDALGS